MMDSISDFSELIPGLPDDIALECLTRLHYGAHSVASDVCRRWRRLLQDREFYYQRQKSGFTRKVACVVQSLPIHSESGQADSKPEKQQKYGLSVFDPNTGEWHQIDPVPKYPDGLPLFCQVASSEGKLVVMGGWNPASWEPLRDVFVYEFTTRRWTQRVDMPSTRSFFAAGACNGRVYVAGGHDENKNALRSAWVYDIAADEWAELNPMSEERDECEGVVVGGSEFWVISGYDTDSQGRFKSSAEVLDIGSGTWRRVEEAWGVSGCPRSCVSIGENGSLTSWDTLEPAVRVGTCGVDLGDRVLVTGSAYQGAPQTVFVMEKANQGQSGKLIKLDVPDDFSGFVQSGCLVEI